MASPFSRSPSGDTFEGTNPDAGAPGDVFPRWNNTLKEWEPATIPSSGGGGGDPLSNVLFADGGTLVAPADQTGAISAPFSDIPDALLAVPSATVLVTPGYTYSAFSVADGENAKISSLAPGPLPGGATLGDASIGDGASVSIRGCITGAITFTGTGGEASRIYESSVDGAISGNQDVTFYGDAATNDGTESIVGAVVDVRQIVASGYEFAAAITTTLNATLVNCDFTGNPNLTVGGDLFWDLRTAAAFRARGGTLAVTGTVNIIDAPTVSVECNVDDVSGAPTIIQRDLAVSGARPGDTFAVAINSPSGAITDIAIGSAYCLANNQVTVPIIILAGASAVSLDLTVTRFSVETTGP